MFTRLNTKSIAVTLILIFITAIGMSSCSSSGSRDTPISNNDNDDGQVIIGNVYTPAVEVVGQWKLSGNGDWNDCLLTFSPGNMLVTDNAQNEIGKGDYTFLNEKTIYFFFPDHQGVIRLEEIDTSHIKMTIQYPAGSSPVIYSAEKVSE